MVPEKQLRPYGLWDSPLTILRLEAGVSLSEIAWDAGGQPGAWLWQESRPERSAIVVQAPDGQAWRDLNGEYSARGGVGYGGGTFCARQGQVYFVEGRSGQIFRQPVRGGLAQAVTPPLGQAAAPALSPDGRWLLYVHTLQGQDCLAVVDAAGRNWPQKLAEGADFYMQPAWHPDGARIAWVQWNHPNMPWDGCELYLGALRPVQGQPPLIDTADLIAGSQTVSVFQPAFSPDGRYLAYVSDESGWGQIYLYELATGKTRQLTQAPAEHGTPAWIQGMRTFAFGLQPAKGSPRLYFLRNQDALTTLWEADLDTGAQQEIPLGDTYTYLEQITVGGEASNPQIALLASGPAQPPRLIVATLPDGQAPQVNILRRSSAEEFPGQAFVRPQAVTWAGLDGETVHGLLYPPHNPNFYGQGRPPLIVSVHGGPTGQARNGWNPEAQLFASRGYAFLEVNFRGSSGYGRAYQDALHGQWGLIEVQDAVSGAQHLVDQGQADAGRLVIMGGSSGGYAVLRALEDYPDFFRAGVCRYGISNLFTLSAETHKFEAHYNDSLLGVLPAAAEVFRQRSPLFGLERIRTPLALFHGEDDPVVPMAQSEVVAEALQRRGVPCVFKVYPGEGHGFHQPETLSDYYRTVETFLRDYVIWGMAA